MAEEIDDRFRSRRWILANKIINWTNFIAFICLLVAVLEAKDHVHDVISGILLFLGTVYSLTYGVYGANRAVESWKKNS